MQIKIYLMNITQTGKYKTLNMAGHKTDMNITKIDKYEKNWTAILWRSTKYMNITKYKNTEHDGAQNRYGHY